MSDVLSSAQRRALDTAVQRARQVAEAAAAEELRRLGVGARDKPSYLLEDDAALRRALRDKARQLGDDLDGDLRLLKADIAYEQWHRLLFARFLAENGLLRHPEAGVAVTLADCAGLASHEGEPDGWMVAARYASRILPGVFRLTDPAFQVRYSPERRAELEAMVEGLDDGLFTTEDALGWVYQFWQTAEKKRVNVRGDKIGGADLSPVTQLFTENYMVRFLLENSLGAWWAARHPDSPLVDGWEYLRRLDDGTPAAGTFDEWPATAAEVTVMDPCCGSGHFLVAAFGMLWRMRAEEEGLSPVEAQDAVLRDNLFGLELDPRCTQIATFNLVFEAWKQSGYRSLPAPQVACSGIPVRASREDWEALAGDDAELRAAMGRLHTLFRHADTLGSLISPKPSVAGGALLSRDFRAADSWPKTMRMLAVALVAETDTNSALSGTARDVARAAEVLSREYVLVVTNPPFLGRSEQDDELAGHADRYGLVGKSDLATMMLERALGWVGEGATIAMVTPQSWLDRRRQSAFRELTLRATSWRVVGRLGSRAFRAISGEVVNVVLGIWVAHRADARSTISVIDVAGERDPESKAEGLALARVDVIPQPTPEYGGSEGILASRRNSTLGDHTESQTSGSS